MPIKHTIGVPLGFTYLLWGVKMIFSSWKIFRLSLAPMAVNIILFSGFLLSFNTIVYYLSNWAFEQSTQEWYWAALSVLGGIILFGISLLAAILAFGAVGIIIASPFNDFLSSAIEEKLTGKVVDSKLTLTQMAFSTIKNESRKVAIFFVIEVGLFVLNFIPVVGQTLFVVLNALFLSFVMSYEFSGYTLDRHNFTFGDKKNFIFSIFGKAVGFGLGIGFTIMIPIIHFMIMPVAVAGGTIMAIENLGEERPQTPPKENKPTDEVASVSTNNSAGGGPATYTKGE